MHHVRHSNLGFPKKLSTKYIVRCLGDNTFWGGVEGVYVSDRNGYVQAGMAIDKFVYFRLNLG